MRDRNKTKKQLTSELAGLHKRVAEWESTGSLHGSAAGAGTASESGADEQLAELEHLYRTAPVGLAFLDAKLRYRRINERLAAINGASVEAHIGRTVADMIPGIADRVTAIHRKVLRAGKPVLNVQVSGVLPSDLGEEHTWLASYYPIKSEAGTIRGISAMVLDVTEMKRAEKALRESEIRARKHLAELTLIYDTAPIGLCFVDTDLRFVRINKELAAINGVSVADSIGRTLREVIPDIAYIVEPIYREVLETNEAAIEFEVSGVTPAAPNVERHWLVSYYPVTSEGRRLGVSTVVQEITYQKRAEQAGIKLKHLEDGPPIQRNNGRP